MLCINVSDSLHCTFEEPTKALKPNSTNNSQGLKLFLWFIFLIAMEQNFTLNDAKLETAASLDHELYNSIILILVHDLYNSVIV